MSSHLRYSFPQTVNECPINENIKVLLNTKIEKKLLNNLIIYGEYYTCKSILVDSIVRDYYKTLKSNDNYYISYNPILNKINKSFEQIVSDLNKSYIYNQSYKKIVIIDDFDLSQNSFQQSLNSLLDCYPNITFILICTAIENLDQGVISRFSVIYLEKISYECYKEYLDNRLFRLNNINIVDIVLQQMYVYSNGDIHFSINHFDVLYKLYGNDITLTKFVNLYNIPDVITITNFLKLCIDPDSNLSQCINECRKIYNMSYSSQEILEFMWELLKDFNVDKILEESKQQMCLKLCDSICKISKFGESLIQLLICIIKIYSITHTDS